MMFFKEPKMPEEIQAIRRKILSNKPLTDEEKKSLDYYCNPFLALEAAVEDLKEGMKQVLREDFGWEL